VSKTIQLDLAKDYYKSGAITDVAIVCSESEFSWKVQVTLLGDNVCYLAKARSNTLKTYKSVNAAVNDAKQIGVSETKVIFGS
jgi:hypothetical protein|tara:strand:+ start:109 stop:357 length:249 start_codon:yes stop_codon:yes gene_type:complete